MAASTLLVENDDRGIRWITFNRPATLNALTADDLVAGIGALRDLTGVTAVVFTGAGDRAFSTGMHVDAFLGLDVPAAGALIGTVRDFVAAARTAPVPTVCAIHGYCLGAAMELAIACDLRVATTTAAFGMPEITVGIPSVIDSSLLAAHIGLARAKEMLLTGDVYDVGRLDGWGFLNAVVAPDALRASVEALLGRIVLHSPVALAAQKRLFEAWANLGLQDGIEASVAEFAATFADPQTQERAAAHRARLARS